MVGNASRRLFILCKLKKFGVKPEDLVFIYSVYIRPILGYAVPVWGSGLTLRQSAETE